MSSSAAAVPRLRHPYSGADDIDFAALKADLAVRAAPAVTAPIRVSGMPSTAQVLDIGGHHGLQSLDARRQAEPAEAGVHSLPRFFHTGRDGMCAGYGSFGHGVALPQGIDARSLRARAEERRSAYFNIDRDIPVLKRDGGFGRTNRQKF